MIEVVDETAAMGSKVDVVGTVVVVADAVIATVVGLKAIEFVV